MSLWAINSRERLRQVLGYPATKLWLTNLDIAMSSVEVSSPETIFVVEGLLDEWESTRSTQTSSLSESALVKAGPLEWVPGMKNAGYSLQLKRLKREISETLGIYPYSYFQPASIGVYRA